MQWISSLQIQDDKIQTLSFSMIFYQKKKKQNEIQLLVRTLQLQELKDGSIIWFEKSKVWIYFF